MSSVTNNETTPLYMPCSNQKEYDVFEGGVKIVYHAEWISKEDYSTVNSYPEFFGNEPTLCFPVNMIDNTCCLGSFNDQLGNYTFPYSLPVKFFLRKRNNEIIELISKSKNQKFNLTYNDSGDEYLIEKNFMITYLNMKKSCNKNSQKWLTIQQMKTEYFPNSHYKLIECSIS